MTGKERANFRARANKLDPEFQIGKDGVTDGVVSQTLDSFNTKELLKIRVLTESCPDTPREAADKLSEKVPCEVIQVIGGIIVLYKENPNLEDGKPKPKKKAAAPKKSKPLSKVRAKRELAQKKEAQRKLEKRDFYAKRKNNK